MWKCDYTHSYMTILTASLSRDSPKMTVYSLGSTLYWLKMARIVTGSVAESVEPKIRHSTRVNPNDSSPSEDHMNTITLRYMWSALPRRTTIDDDYTPYSDRGYECAEECEDEDRAEITKEFFLLQFVSGV